MIDYEIKEMLGARYNNYIDNDYKIWKDCYSGESYWLQDIGDADYMQSLNLCAAISSELARLTVMEFESKVDDETINNIYKKFLKKIRKFTEYGLALGSVIVKPYIQDYEKKIIDIDITPADKFIILGFTSFGDINHIVFIDKIKKQDKKDRDIYFTRLEEHEITDIYTIKNTAYMSNNPDNLGDEINLKVVDEWENISELETLNRDTPLFAYFKNPQANNLDMSSEDGISCFARALSLIQDADEQYQRILWEFKGGELAIDADITVMKANGTLPKGKERLFRNLGADQKDDFYSVFSPTLRDSSLINGLNNILKKVEFTCGLAYGTISDLEYTAKTATEIKMSQQRSYSTVTDIQRNLEETLREFIEIIHYWCTELRIPVSDDYEVSFDFDDSIVVDSEVEQKIRLQEVASGILSPEAYLKWRYGASDDEVKDLLPNVEEDPDDVLEEE